MQKIFVGDVQGCGEEFETLVTRARETFARDFELWNVGDLINRGPKNLLALRLMRELCDEGQGKFILGNHEIGLLRVWLGLVEIDSKSTYPEILDDPSCVQWIDWLRHQPVALCGEVGDATFAMVHAASHPDWSRLDLEAKARRIAARLSSPNLDDLRSLVRPDLDTNDSSLIEDRDTLGRLTRCRSVDSHDQWSSAQPSGDSRAWHEVWSERRHDFGIVYGHWAMQGVHVAHGLRGLDSGCVHHGRGRDGFLTAWLPTLQLRRKASTDARQGNSLAALDVELDEFAAPDDRFWQIPARRRYYD